MSATHDNAPKEATGFVVEVLSPVEGKANGPNNYLAWAASPHEGADMRALELFSQTLGDNNNGNGVIGHLLKSYCADEDISHGLRLTTRPAARDNIGYPVRTPLDNLISVNIAVRNAATLAPIAAGLREWSVCLYFYIVD